MATELIMIFLLLAVFTAIIINVIIKQGIEIHEILILVNVGYFLFSGLYHLSYEEQEVKGYNYNDNTIFTAYLGVILYAIGILISTQIFRSKYILFSMKESRSSAFHALKHYYDEINPKAITFLFITSLVLKFYYYVHGGRIIYGIGFNKDEDPLQYPLQLLNFVWNIINYGLFGYALINIFYKKNTLRFISLAIIIVEMSIATLSRRDFAFNVLIILIIYLSTIKRINPKAIILLATTVILTTQIILPEIFSFRSQLATEFRETGDISESFANVFKSSDGTSDTFEIEITEENKNYSENLATRGYIMSSNLELVHAQESSKTAVLNGQLLFSSILFIIPYFIFPGKRDYLPPDALVLEHFKLPPYDHSENMPYAGYADFGFYGPVIYGVFIGLAILIIQHYTIKNLRKFPLASLSSIIYLLIFCLNFEGLASNFFILIRDVFLIFGLSSILTIVTRKTIFDRKAAK